MRPAHGTLRLTRTAFLAAACTGLAWGGHNLWAEVPAPVGGFAAATAVLFPVLWFFTRSMRGFGDILAVMATVQVVLHLVLQGSADPALAAVHPDPGAGHAGHGLLAHTLGFAPGMLLAHLWAALLASALLAHGEAALWFLAALLGRALPPLLVPGLVSDAAPARIRRADRSAAPSSDALSAHGPRGPPGAYALALQRGPEHAAPRAGWTRTGREPHTNAERRT